MRLLLAIKAFFKALQEPEKVRTFLLSSSSEPKKETADVSHLRLLALLQHSSRLIDFLKEDLASYDDVQIGAAVRKIHEDSGKCLEDIVTIRPVMEQTEGSQVTIPHGYDPSKIKIIGQVKGQPPFHGTLVHKGWKAHKRSLPKKVGDQLTEIICPAEVEIK